MQAETLRCPDGLHLEPHKLDRLREHFVVVTYLPDTAHPGDVLWEALEFILRIACFDEVVGSNITEGEESVRENLTDFGVEVMHVVLVW